MAAECMDALQYMPRAIDIPDRRLLLFLPLSHVFARFMATVAFAGTLTLGLTSNMKTIIKDFEDFGPTLLLASRAYSKRCTTPPPNVQALVSPAACSPAAYAWHANGARQAIRQRNSRRLAHAPCVL